MNKNDDHEDSFRDEEEFPGDLDFDHADTKTDDFFPDDEEILVDNDPFSNIPD